jgi:hypothetical protein
VNVQTHLAERRLHLGCTIGRRQVVERSVVLERLANGEEGIVSGALRHIGEPGWDVVSGDRLTEPGNASIVGTEQTGEAQKKRRFTGARPPNQPDDFTNVDVEGDIAQCWQRQRAVPGSGVIGLVDTSDK